MFRLFRSKLVAQTRNTWRMIRRQPRLKVYFIAAFATLFEVGLWSMFYEGFVFLERFGAAGMITTRLFALFFLGLGIMLVMSGVVTAYAAYFRSEEIPYLLVRPISLSHIVIQKFIEAAMLSSWAFFFIVLPFVGAFAQFHKMSPLFIVWTFLYSVPFLAICSGVGVVTVLVLVRWFPVKSVVRVLLAVAAAGGLAALWAVREYRDADTVQFALSTLVPGMVLATNPLIPSTWAAEGILALSKGNVPRGGMLLAVLVSTALMVGMLVEWLGVRTFYESWQRVEVGGGRRLRPGRAFLAVEHALGFMPAGLRGVVMKDIRTFFRDPMQWSQVLIFFGLLGMYFANLRTFRYHTYGAVWQNMVCFLNVFSVAAVMCSLGARFTFPQLSLEGHSFWILGLSPVRMRVVLAAKFLLAFVSLSAVSAGLIVLSSWMLNAEPVLRVVSAGLVVGVAVAVSGLSTGLGAVFMDLKERNPAAIVGGFGGTLNLVLGLGYMLGVIVPFGVLFHLRAAEQLRGGEFRMGVAVAAGWTLALTVAAALVPMVVGLRALDRRDY